MIRGRKHYGQVLVELLLAFAITSISLISMAQIATKSVANSGYARNRSEAVRHANVVMEWVRGMRNTNLNFYSLAGTYCVNGALGATPTSSGACTSTMPETIFSREVVFTPAGGNQQTVEVTVDWVERGQAFESKQTTIFRRY